MRKKLFGRRQQWIVQYKMSISKVVVQVIGRYKYRLFHWGIERLYYLSVKYLWKVVTYIRILLNALVYLIFATIFLLNIECTSCSFMNIKVWLGGMLASPLSTYYSSVWKYISFINEKCEGILYYLLIVMITNVNNNVACNILT